MKVIVLTPKDIDNFKIDIIADSALQKSGKPFFIPEFAEKFQAKTKIAAHINRLGKNISRKFADRYYQEIGLCLSITATDLLSELQKNGEPWAKATAFDGSTIIGEFFDKRSIGNNVNVKVETNTSCEEFAEMNLNEKIEYAIEYASKFFTLKIGDIILLETNHKAINLSIGNKITASINGNDSIDIKIK